MEIIVKNDVRRNFFMSFILNMGYVIRDIYFFMIEFDRSEVFVVIGLVCLFVIFLYLCNKKSFCWKKMKM